MTLDGAINLNETNEYTIYTMNSVVTGQYGVVVPKNINGTLNMLVDLHMKGSFDSVGNGTKTKEQLISEIAEEYNKLKAKYVDGMLVMPMIDEAIFQSTVLNGDKQKMFDEVKKIGVITSELYKKLTDSGIDKQKIDQKIIIVEKNTEDEKFVAWLKEQMPNFVDGILYSELNQVQEVVNPFAGGDIFDAPVQVEEPKVEVTAATIPAAIVEPVVSPVIENAAPVEPVVSPVVENAAPVEPVVSPVVENAAPVEPVATPVVENTTPVESVLSDAPKVDLFGASVSNSSVQVNEPVSVPSQETVVQNVAPVANAVVEEPVVGPKPVDSAMLEGTIAFTPIPNHPNNAVQTDSSVEESVETTKKGSKGFVNLAILLVVLVGVTLLSIELGKYLYNVYGA